MYFPQEEDYVIQFSQARGAQIHYYMTDFVNGLNLFNAFNFPINCIFMGLRRDDSSNDMQITMPSTSPYPEFIRVFPILDFNYSEIWSTIIIFKAPYLSLYDEGFSSIGKKHSSKKNDNLIVDGKTLPAFCLEDLESERKYRY